MAFRNGYSSIFNSLSNVMTAFQIYKFEVYVMLSHTFSIPLSNTWLICESKYVCHFTDSCFWRYWGDFWGTNKIPSWLTGETKVSNLSPGNLSRKSDFVFTSECRNRPQKLQQLDGKDPSLKDLIIVLEVNHWFIQSSLSVSDYLFHHTCY